MAKPQDLQEAREDMLLGHMLLRQKFVTPEQLQRALAEQAAGLARGRKRPRRLGIILAEQGRLTNDQYVGFLREVEEKIEEENAARKQDQHLGVLLLAHRRVSQDQLNECLRLQAEAFDRGEEEILRLGELLIEKGYAKPEVVVQAMTVLEKERPATAPVPPAAPAAPKPPRPAAAAPPPLRIRPRAGAPVPAKPAVPVRPAAAPAAKPAVPAKPTAPLRPAAAPPATPAAPGRPAVAPAAKPAVPAKPEVPASPPGAPDAPPSGSGGNRKPSRADLPLIESPVEEPPDDEETISAT